MQEVQAVEHVSKVAQPNRQMALMNKARSRSSFDPYKLSCIIYKGQDTVQRRRAAFKRVENATGTANPAKLPKTYASTDREATYLDGVEMGTAAFVDGIMYDHDFFAGMDQRYTLSNCTPYGLHYMMFLPTIELQGTKEQVAHWLPLAKQGKICGCYVQTELAHGTFVRGVETTATFDIERDQFVINSPTLTSAKFWPGAMASSCTHGVLMARLIVGENDYGVHPFIVPLRNLDDFMPIEGIEFGDLGMKMGYNGTTNGYAIFNNVRIPRDHLLMRYARVERDGTYVEPEHDKFAYLTMLYARAVIAAGSGFKLAQAATIATRYSTVREQGEGPNGEASADGGETAIINYRSQNFRLFTILSRAYAIHFTSQTIDSITEDLKSIGVTTGLDSMAYCHILLAGLKAWNTQVASDGAEDARKCCGGHGFVLTSGLPSIVAEAAAPATFEGENYVMYQQVGRYLLKCWNKLKAGKQIEPRMTEMRAAFDQMYTNTNTNGINNTNNDRCTVSGTQFLDPITQLSMFQHRTFRLLDNCNEALAQSQRHGHSPGQAWNKHMMQIIAAGRAYIELLVLQDFTKAVSPSAATPITDPAIRLSLSRLRSLFALTTITHPSSYDALSFVEEGYLSPNQMRDIRACVDELLDGLLPDAIALTDAWDFTDASLSTAIGQYDGNIYETLLSWTRQMPINKGMNEEGSICKQAWDGWIKPALDPELRARL